MDTKQKIFRIVSVAIVVVGLIYAVLFVARGGLSFLWATKTDPSKTELKNSTPSDLVGTVGLEKETDTYNESYTLDYGLGNGDQSTVVRSVAGEVEDQHSFYNALLKEEGWSIKRSHIDANISFLYATKEDREINITISLDRVNASLSNISISMYRK